MSLPSFGGSTVVCRWFKRFSFDETSHIRVFVSWSRLVVGEDSILPLCRVSGECYPPLRWLGIKLGLESVCSRAIRESPLRVEDDSGNGLTVGGVAFFSPNSHTFF